MPSPTTARGMLGHFPRGADPPATDQHASLPPVQYPTSLSLRAISVAGAGGRGVRGGASGCRIPRDGRGGGRGAGGGGQGRRRGNERQSGGRDKDGGDDKDGGTGARRTGPNGTTQSGNQQQIRGGVPHGGGAGQEESADESAKWSGTELEGLATEEEETTAGGAGWENVTRTATAGGTQDSVEGELSEDTAAGGSNTGKATSAVAD